MNRFTFYIIASIVCIMIPIVGVLYGFWDSNQPKTGPVGHGKAPLTFIQLFPIISTFLLGVINLPIAINRYKKHKESKSVENNKS